jgi:hypothetical protein
MQERVCALEFSGRTIDAQHPLNSALININSAKREEKIMEKKKLTTAAGRPVGDNQN